MPGKEIRPDSSRVIFGRCILAQHLAWKMRRCRDVPAGTQRAVYPPSTGRATPTTRLAPGLQSHSTAAAISAGAAEPTHRLVCNSVGHAEFTPGDHAGDHGRFDGS